MTRVLTLFGAALREARRVQDKTLGDVADVIEISAAHLSDVERGNRKPLCPDDIEKIAAFLHADVYALLAAAAQDRKEIRYSTKTLSSKKAEYGLVLMRGLHELSEDEIAAHVAMMEQQLKAKGH